MQGTETKGKLLPIWSAVQCGAQAAVAAGGGRGQWTELPRPRRKQVAGRCSSSEDPCEVPSSPSLSVVWVSPGSPPGVRRCPGSRRRPVFAPLRSARSPVPALGWLLRRLLSRPPRLSPRAVLPGARPRLVDSNSTRSSPLSAEQVGSDGGDAELGRRPGCAPGCRERPAGRRGPAGLRLRRRRGMWTPRSRASAGRARLGVPVRGLSPA